MARRAVIHIGIAKTGTSSLQRELFDSRESLLSKFGILYPSLWANLSVHLQTMFQDPPASLQFLDSRARDKEQIETIRREYFGSLESDLQGKRWHTLIISAERLGNFSASDINAFMDWLLKYVQDVTVVAYVRHPIDWCRAIIQQSLQTHGTTLEQLYAAPPIPEWKRRFSPWIEALGEQNFELLSTEETVAGRGLIKSFCQASRLPSEDILQIVPGRHRDEDISYEATLLLDALNRHAPLFDDDMRVSESRQWGSTNAVKEVYGQTFYLPSEQVKLVRKSCKNDLRWLQETFGVNWYSDIFSDTASEFSEQGRTHLKTWDSLAKILSDIGHRVASMKTRADTQNTQLQALRRQNHNFVLQVENLKSQNRNLSLQVESLRSQKSKYNEQALRLKGKNEASRKAMQAQLAGLRTQIHSLQDSNFELQEDNIILRSRINRD